MLNVTELNLIKALKEICEKEGDFELKLNFDMLENRSDSRKEDFFHYENNLLVGFLGIYSFGSTVELCGMVHPDYRRRGIFSKLLQSALDDIKKQPEVETILLNAPTDSPSAKAFLNRVPCEFSFAEYQMQWCGNTTELAEDPHIGIRPAQSEEDWESIIQLEVSGFGVREEDVRAMNQTIRNRDTDHNLIIEMDGKTVGKMRVSETNGEAWIYGFVVSKELRGQGIGRKALSKVVKIENQKGLPIFLEVEARNRRALGLYESCGFRSYHSQDYYTYLN